MGVPLPVVGATVAVNVTLAPIATGLGDTESVAVLAVVPTPVTVKLTALDVLVEYVLSPP